MKVSASRNTIDALRETQALKALPIVGVDKEKRTLFAANGMEMREYGTYGSGTWVETGQLQEGAIRYLGSSTHAGHIELKALYVLVENEWHNIVSGHTEPLEDETSKAVMKGSTP